MILSGLACRLWMDVIEARSLSDMAAVLENVGSFAFSVFGQATGATLRGEEGKRTGAGVMLPRDVTDDCGELLTHT